MDTKQCSKCGSEHPLDDFPRAGSRGRGSWCRPCARAANRAWKDRNRDKVNAAKRAARAREREERPTLKALAERVARLEAALGVQHD
jgi:hypothetical protein